MKTTQQSWIVDTFPTLFLKPPTGVQAIEILNFMGFESALGEADLALEVKKEYTRFFSAPGQHKLPPYESYWHLKKQEEDPVNAPRLYSRTTDEVKAIYERLEIQALDDLHEPPDHIGFELSVFLTLVHAEDNVPQEVKKEFIEGHVLLWIPAYLKQLADKQGYFYPLIAKYLLKNFF